MLASLNSTDITKLINESSYKMDSEDVYENWTDGNFREHRVIARSKISGSFEVALYGQDGYDTKKFLELWNGAVRNHIVTILVYVANEGKMRAIEAYYEIAGKSHRQLSSGKYLDILSIKLEER